MWLKSDTNAATPIAVWMTWLNSVKCNEIQSNEMQQQQQRQRLCAKQTTPYSTEHVLFL